MLKPSCRADRDEATERAVALAEVAHASRKSGRRPAARAAPRPPRLLLPQRDDVQDHRRERAPWITWTSRCGVK